MKQLNDINKTVISFYPVDDHAKSMAGLLTVNIPVDVILS